MLPQGAWVEAAATVNKNVTTHVTTRPVIELKDGFGKCASVGIRRMKRLGAKSQQKTMRGRGTDGLQRCSGSDHEPYAQTDHNKRNSTTKQSESRTNRPRAGKLRLAKRQPETIVIGRLNEKEEKQEAERSEGEERELVR